MLIGDGVANAWKRRLGEAQGKIFNFQMVKPYPSDWVEGRIVLPEGTTRYPGPFSYKLTPYCREIINHLHPSSPTKQIAVMKSSQCGITAGVVVPGICYIIDQIPDPILFTAADKEMAGRTLAERLDPILSHSGLSYLIRPNVIKKQNSRTGDTKYSKEYAGGQLTAAGTSNPDTFRYFSAKTIFGDDFETAPREAGDQGDVTKLMQGRQKSYGDDAITYYISTPEVTGSSLIWEQYQKGTMKKWNWKCPACGDYFPVEWSVKLEGGHRAGIIYELNSFNDLKPESIRYKTQCCGAELQYKDKYQMNQTGIWVGTNERPRPFFESYYLNDLVIPPGFDTWETVVNEWLEANPPGRPAIVRKLKAFNNQRLGLPFEDLGETPKSNQLMKNVGQYKPGTIPDVTCEEQGNGKIILITLACDLNGEENDARLDWAIVAHCSTTTTYEINHGSIGTFKRLRDRTPSDVANDGNRIKYTYDHEKDNSVWPILEEIIKAIYIGESGEEADINLTAIDTGFQERNAMQFVINMQEQSYRVYGVKGKTELKYRKTSKDSMPVKRSIEHPKRLYNVEVDQLKDDLSELMKLTPPENGDGQPAGFMNFPQQNDGKYTYEGYFLQYEGERRVEEKKDDVVIGSKWIKKNSQSINHFWDVRVYNLAAPYMYLDLLRQSDPAKYKNITWEDFVILVTA